MKVILLSGNKVALVDDQDCEFISKWGWRAQQNHHKGQVVWYAVRTEKGMEKKRRTVYMHREILKLQSHDGIKTDHADGDGLNNQRFNLRRADSSSNAMNSRKRPGSSQHKGVSQDKRDQAWQARVHKDDTTIYLGRFLSEEEAAIAYNQKAQELFGEFAKTNVV